MTGLAERVQTLSAPVSSSGQPAPFKYPTPAKGAIQSLAWTHAVPKLAWSPEVERLGVTSFSPPPKAEGITDVGGAYVFTPATGRLDQLPAAPALTIDGLAWSPDNAALAIVEPEGVAIVDVVRQKRLAAIETKRRPLSISWSTISGDLAVALAPTNDEANRVEIYRLNQRPELMRFIERDSSVHAQVVSIGWSPNGKHLAGLICDYAQLARLVIWHGSEEIGGLQLGSGWVVRPVISQAWLPSGIEIVIAFQPIVPSGSETEIADYTEIVVWKPFANPPAILRRQFKLGPFGVFGAQWSPDGRFITCCTGEEILIIDPEDLHALDSLPSYYSEVTPAAITTEDGEWTVTGLGFTVRHNWSSDGNWLVAGNVGGLALWDTRLLRFE